MTGNLGEHEKKPREPEHKERNMKSAADTYYSVHENPKAKKDPGHAHGPAATVADRTGYVRHEKK